MIALRYLKLDRAIALIIHRAQRRARIWRCFWSGDRVGHEWNPKTTTVQYGSCTRCPKVWIGG